MKHLISATLSLEAGQVWESWPKGQRSKLLSVLLVDEGTMHLQRQADLLMIGSLRGNTATHRRRLIDFLSSTPPIDKAYSRMFDDIIWEMNEDLAGSIHHEPIPELRNQVVDDED